MGLRVDKTSIPQFGNREENTVEFGNVDYNEGIFWLTALPPPCAEKGVAPCNPDPGGGLPTAFRCRRTGGFKTRGRGIGSRAWASPIGSTTARP